MIYYLLLAISALLFSVQFVFTDGYGKSGGSGFDSSLKFLLYGSILGLPILLLINKFHFEFTWFSLCVAFVYSLANVGMTYFSLKAFTCANLSVYSVFAMIGGMLLPFAYGILSGEKLKALNALCCIIIILAVIMSAKGEKSSPKAIKYYLAVFVINGTFGIISKFHQSQTALAVDSGSFIILTKITAMIISLVPLVLMKDKSYKISFRQCVYLAGHACVNNIGNLFLMISLLYLPASVQYPIITGGTIVFSAIISLIRRERVTKLQLVSAAVAFTGTVFMAL